MDKKIVVLTGAGISAESGIRTFRDGDGLWEEHRIEDVATPEGFARNPELVLNFYNQRRRQLLNHEIKPNKAHLALARLERYYPGDVIIITQNIDNLHERAGSKAVIHMHGELLKKLCANCNSVHSVHEDMMQQDLCPNCHEPCMRPHIVWFGEMPLDMNTIYQHLTECNIFSAIGTSGQVYPAAGFAQFGQDSGATTYQINMEPTNSTAFDHNIYGKATETVIPWVDNMLETVIS